MWYCPKKYEKTLPDINAEFEKLKGELDDKTARRTLAQFLRANVGIAVELISDIILTEYQEITLKGFLNRNFSMCVWGRGCAKSFIAAIFCFFMLIFEPGSKIVIAGPTFRTARHIFTKLEEIVANPKAKMLADIFVDDFKSKRNDLFEWRINGGSVVAIPLNGEKIRGFRANILLLDEYLLLSEDMVKMVLMPFLSANQDAKERLKTKRDEDELVKLGKMKDEDRKVFADKTKMIVLSSASYTFDNLYKQYCEWKDKIYDEKSTGDATYFISQIGYEAIPKELLSETLIEEAENGGSSHASFQREYGAQFTDGSDSYFSAKKMKECTIKDGDAPHLELVGSKGSRYILSIDPSFSNSPTSDNFAMAVIKIDEEGHGVVVHQYAVAGGDLKEHIDYLYYLWKSFNIELIIMDSAGGWKFLESANLSANFIKDKIEFKLMNFDSDKEGTDEYPQMLKDARRSYNKQDFRICIDQLFTSEFIRKSNEYLQANIDHKRVWFASRLNPDSTIFEKSFKTLVPLEYTRFDNVLKLIDEQDLLIAQVKTECALVEVKTTAKGTQSFDLPLHLKKSSRPDKARKDSYTALKLGNWGVKCYNDLMAKPVENNTTTFMPRII